MTKPACTSSVQPTVNDDDGNGKGDEHDHKKQRNDSEDDGQDVVSLNLLVFGRVKRSNGLQGRRRRQCFDAESTPAF